MTVYIKEEKVGKQFFIDKKQSKHILFLSVFILLKTLPCTADVSPCQAEFIEEEQEADEDALLELAEKAEQLMGAAGEMLDKIKYVEENKSLFFEEEGENVSSASSHGLQSLEEIRSAREFFSNAYKEFQRMANIFLNQATGTGPSAFQNLEDEFHKLEGALNRKSAYLERQINELLSKTIDFQNKTNNSSGKQLLLEDLMENPHLLQADTPYFVEFSNNPASAFIIFDESVVDVFLNPKDRAFHFDLLKKNLSSIKKGFTNGTGLTGLKFLGRSSGNRGSENKYKDIFEVKTMGRVAGNVRLGGFRDDQGNLHIVHYRKGSEHEVGKMNDFVNTIISRRDFSGKTSYVIGK